MKVAAHPMLVAVALGLLAPAALADTREAEDRKIVSETAETDSSHLQTLVQDSVSSDEGPYWARLDLGEADYPGEADHEAAEQAWMQARKI